MTPLDKTNPRNPRWALNETNPTMTFPIDRRSAPNEKGDAAVTASPQNLSPASNGESTHEF